MSSLLPPLMPKVDAILVLDGDGNRLAGKYYSDFLKNKSNTTEQNELRTNFEKQVHVKISSIPASLNGAEIVTVQNKTVVFCGGPSSNSTNPNDCIRIVHVGPNNESELVLAYLCEGMYDALCQLMGSTPCDRSMVLDNLELVFLLIDEHCDGGIILEVDGHKLASAVLLRDDVDASNMNHPTADGVATSNGGGPLPTNHYNNNVADMTIGQAIRQAHQQFMAGMTSRDGM